MPTLSVPTTVSFADCRRELLDRAGPAGRAAYDHWRRTRGEEVVGFVEGFTHEHLFRVTAEEVRATLHASEHALGDVRSREQLAVVEDFTCPYALEHVFHRFVEERRRLPTWQCFRRWVREEVPEMWFGPLRAALAGWSGGQSREQLGRAARWRLGKFYYSAMREVELLARLRATGLPLRYHLLADCLLRVDFWSGDTLVCTYFPNPRYRDGDTGRKPQASRFFPPGGPFRVLHAGIERQGFGEVWLASGRAARALARELGAPARDAGDRP